MLHNMLRAAAGRDRIPTDGLILHYTMDNISGSTLVDETASYDSTIYGATQSTGFIGQALNFDGVDDYCNSGSLSGTAISDPSVSGALAISFYMYARGGDYVVSSGGQTASRGFSYMNRNPAYLVLKDGTNEWVGSSVTRAQQNQWVHVCINWDGSNLYLFYDDVEVYSLSPSPAAVEDDHKSLSIGCPSSSLGNLLFDGMVDQLRIYNRALTSGEITQLYNEGA